MKIIFRLRSCLIKQCKIIYKKIRKKSYTIKQYQLFEEAKSGDVYFADMPMSKKILKTIPKGHRSRPYLIVGKEGKYLQGYQCSSQLYKNLKNYEYYHYRTAFYKKNKNSYFYLNKVYKIPIKNILEKWDPLIEKDRREIEKRIQISQYNKNQLVHIDANIELEVGNVFNVGKQYYYVYQKDAAHIYSYNVVEKAEAKNPYLMRLQIEKQTWYIDIKKQKIVDTKSYYPVVYLLSNEEIENIANTKRSLLWEEKRKRTKNNNTHLILEYDIGQVLINNNHESYIYLYSFKKRMYGVYAILMYEEIPQIVRIKDEKNLKTVGLADRGKTNVLIKELLSRKIDPHLVLEKISNSSESDLVNFQYLKYVKISKSML